MKLLIVDDDLINRKLLTALLKGYGHSDVAVNGKEAVEFVQIALQEGQPYDVIFLDIMMPEMNGHEALQAIRRLEEKQGIALGRGTKVIMVTALGDSRNVLSAFSEGCEYYLVKPVQQKKLFELLDEMGFSNNQAS
ncbi:MAG: two-component system response regulator [SAR324 cluster bacterium]|uniref:Two-component system response regulator n=1 Tax=SAR324 cluster bacterium TaxID=2024889 RepID=A0A2A4T4B5_9DELT|nr:MAG: two-component system response regulator [SAR324 cluster bacterium]